MPASRNQREGRFVGCAWGKPVRRRVSKLFKRRVKAALARAWWRRRIYAQLGVLGTQLAMLDQQAAQ